LYANGCNAKIYANKGSAEYLRVAFKDSYKIMLSDMAYIEKVYGKKLKQPYTEEDIDKVINSIVEVDYDIKLNVSDFFTIRLSSAYHIAMSSQIELFVRDGNYRKKLYFSGDLGNININKPFLEPFNKIVNSDIAVVESTYAMNLKNVTEKTRTKDREKLQTVIRETCEEKGGKVIIASFSMQRLQELMYELYFLYKDSDSKIPIVIDTPLGIKISNLFESLIPTKDVEVWNEIMNWDRIQFINDWEDSESCILSSKPMIVIASSGFCEGGRIRSYIKENLNNENNTFVFVGYSSEDSLAGIIKNGKKKYIEIDGVSVKNKAKVVNLMSFSSHMQHNEMLKYYSDMNCQEIYLVHGEKSKQYEFAQLLEDRYRGKNKTTKVFVPNMNDTIEI
jgi:metallo-beta-lactamase family protein